MDQCLPDQKKSTFVTSDAEKMFFLGAVTLLYLFEVEKVHLVYGLCTCTVCIDVFRSIGGQGAGMLVVDYLDKNLVVLKENLNKENFDRIRSVIWESSAQKLDETIQASISRRQPQVA